MGSHYAGERENGPELETPSDLDTLEGLTTNIKEHIIDTQGIAQVLGTVTVSDLN